MSNDFGTDHVAPSDSDLPGGNGLSGMPPPGNPAVGNARSPRRRRSSQRSFWRELPFLIVIALVLALLLQSFILQKFYIPSASMEPTLGGGPSQTGQHFAYDRILVNKMSYWFGGTPQRGQVVVFKKPSYWSDEPGPPPTTGLLHYLQDAESDVGLPVSSTEDIVKRVIGVPGDVVRCRASSSAGQGYGGSVLTVNGHALSEPYLYPGSNECAGSPAGYFTVKVAPGHLYVMGDNRDDSSDSRANPDNPWHGAIPISNVVGRAFAVVWPPSDWRGLGVPSTFHQPGLSSQIATSPPVLGLVGALPITALRRRRKLRGRPSLVRRARGLASRRSR